MLFAIYGPDGQIVQSNKVYAADDGKYDAQLNEMGHQFVKLQAPGLLPPEEWYVHVGAKELRERPMMATIAANKTTFLCGDSDSSLITGIPSGSRVLITMRGGTVVFPKDHPNPWILDATELEISIPTPCVYRVRFDLWPYRTRVLEIEAVAA